MRVQQVILAGLTAITPAWAAARTFHGYVCTDDCSGHIAGYEWARAHDIDDEADCGGNSQSFYEGCLAYVEDGGSAEACDADEDACDEEDPDDCDAG